jgi:hypothetical protein
MAGVATAIAGSAILGAVVNSNSASKAASAQQNAANTASQTQLQMYNQTRADQAPWRQAGGQAVSALSQFYGQPGVDANGNPTQGGTPDYQSILAGLPGYQFQQAQGSKAVQQNLAARGLLQSGAAGKALEQYGQGLGDQYSQQYTQGLQSLAGLGQSSAQATGQAGANAANQVSGAQIYSGNAQASGYVNQANAVNGGLSGIVSGLGYNASQNNPYGTGYNPNGWQQGTNAPSAGWYKGNSYADLNPN